MGKTKVDEIDKAVDDILDDFYGVCVTDLQEAAVAAGKSSAKELKRTSPGEKYPKGWTSKAQNTRTGASVVVYNKDRYMLAHLLEYGHPKINGGRVPGTVHIKPVEEKAMQTFEDEIRKRIENGT